MRLDDFPRFPLTTLPTPLQRARNLESAIGPGCPRIFIKRDDLTGPAFGGNKARKLEYLVADALSKGATVLVTEGPVQSNHARMTAAAAVLAGLKSTLILDSRQGSELQGNLLLDRLMGADVRIVSGKADRKTAMATVADELRASGETPYVVPTGGSVPIGALGYVAFVQELAHQLEEIDERPRRLYFGTGSVGTQAGLVAGSELFRPTFEPVGIAVEETTAILKRQLIPIANGAAELIGMAVMFDEKQITIDDRFVGEGYAIPTPECLASIRLLARTEAIFLDPVYSAKAMSGMLSDIRDGNISAEDSVVFLHTGGGPSLFAQPEILVGA